MNKIVYVLPEQPLPGLLESMATCYDHSFGLPGICETEEEHKERQKRILYQMKKYYDEVSGHGYFKYPQETKLDKIISEADFKELTRFNETSSDNEGYDVAKSKMARLAEIGAIRHHSRGIYSITAFGQFILENENISNNPKNLKTEFDISKEFTENLKKNKEIK